MPSRRSGTNFLRNSHFLSAAQYAAQESTKVSPSRTCARGAVTELLELSFAAWRSWLCCRSVIIRAGQHCISRYPVSLIIHLSVTGKKIALYCLKFCFIIPQPLPQLMIRPRPEPQDSVHVRGCSLAGQTSSASSCTRHSRATAEIFFTSLFFVIGTWQGEKRCFANVNTKKRRGIIQQTQSWMMALDPPGSLGFFCVDIHLRQEAYAWRALNSTLIDLQLRQLQEMGLQILVIVR